MASTKKLIESNTLRRLEKKTKQKQKQKKQSKPYAAFQTVGSGAMQYISPEKNKGIRAYVKISKYIATKERFYIRKEFNFHLTGSPNSV